MSRLLRTLGTYRSISMCLYFYLCTSVATAKAFIPWKIRLGCWNKYPLIDWCYLHKLKLYTHIRIHLQWHIGIFPCGGFAIMQLFRSRLTRCTQMLPSEPVQPNPPFFKKQNRHIKLLSKHQARWKIVIYKVATSSQIKNCHIKLQHQTRQPFLNLRFQLSSIIIA